MTRRVGLIRCAPSCPALVLPGQRCRECNAGKRPRPSPWRRDDEDTGVVGRWVGRLPLAELRRDRVA